MEPQYSSWQYWNESVLKPRAAYHTDFGKSLDVLVSEEPEPEQDLASRIFSDKTRTLKSTVKALFNEINGRERLNAELLGKVEQDISKAHSYLEQIRVLTARDYMQELTLNLNRRRTQLEDRASQLEQEKRREHVECWRDLMHLKRYLLTALKEYWLISRRSAALHLENDERRGNVQEVETYSW